MTISAPVVAFAIVGGFLGRVLAREDTYQHLKVFDDVVGMITNSYVENIASKMPKDKKGAAQAAYIMQTVTRVIGVVVVALTGLIITLKLALYSFGYVYLRKPHVQTLFQNKKHPQLAFPAA